MVNFASGDSQTLLVGLLLALNSLAMVLPGVCAGFISRTHGILAGALSAISGSAVYGAVKFGLLVHSGEFRLSAHSWSFILVFPIIYGLGLLIASVAGGALGQVLRSKTRLSGP
jgi:hypothetical protein